MVENRAGTTAVVSACFVAGVVLMAWRVYLFARLVFAVERYVDRQ